MKTKLAVAFLILLGIGGSTFAQGIRLDATTVQEMSTTAIPGTTNVLTVPAAPIVKFCSFPANAVPCTNLATTFTSSTLGTPCNTSTQITLVGSTTCVASPDANGNFGFWAAAGNYAYTVTLPGGINLGPYNVTLGIPSGTNLPNITVGNLNSIRYVDGVAFTTIDAAVSNCAGAPCIVVIPSTYAGAESAHLVTSTLGYTFYKPVANETVIDNRYATGTGRPNYSYSYNGQNLGQLSRFGVTQSCSSPLDSCVGATITNFIGNTMPANNGTQTGMVSIAAVTGSITRGASTARVVAHEGYVSLDATAADSPFADVRGFTSSVNIDRATSAQGAVTAAGYTAARHTNISASGATITNAYGFDGEQQNAGTSRNYSYHSQGNFLFENAQAIHAVDSGGTPRVMFLFRSDNGIDFQPLSDAVGWNFKTQAGTGLFTVTSANIVSRVIHSFSAGLNVGSGSTLSKYYVVAGAITPAATAANSCVEQTFTPAAFNGVVNAGDNVFLNGSATMAANGVFPVMGVRAVANGIAITYCNSTAGALTAPAVTITVTGTR